MQENNNKIYFWPLFYGFSVQESPFFGWFCWWWFILFIYLFLLSCKPIGGTEAQCVSFKFVIQGCWNTDCNRNRRKKIRLLLLLLKQEIFQYYICQKQCNQFYLSHKLVYLIWQTWWFSFWSRHVWSYFQ